MSSAGSQSDAVSPRLADPGVVRARDVVYDERTAFPTHHHSYSSLFVVVRGSVHEQAGPLREHCGPGSVGFIPAGVEHASSFGPGRSLGVTIVIPDAWLEHAFESATLWRHAGYAQGPHIAADAYRLSSIVQNVRAQTLDVEELLLDVLTHTRAARDVPRVAKESGWVKRIIEFLHDHSDQGVSLADVAAAAGRNPAHVARSFRSSVGCSMSEYLHLVRVARARWMLRTTGMTLSQIAMACGFYDQAHFTRVFSRMMGVSPLRYRQNSREMTTSDS